MGAFPFPIGGQDPGLAPDSGQESFDNFLSVATLGAQTFLANQAITSPRPSSVQVLGNGQIVATGGGASTAGLLSGGSSTLWLFLFGALLFILLLRR